MVRVINGPLRFYIPGKDTMQQGSLVQGKEEYYTARHEVIMQQNDQLTLEPGTKHWFQAGEAGAVLYTFSTLARDVLDKFSDPGIERITKIVD